MKRLLAVLVLLLAFGPRPAYAFNLITDIQQNNQWIIGQPSVGTAIELNTGDLRYTVLSGIQSYRMFSTWYGLSGKKNADGSSYDVQDTLKFGINLAYFFSGFANQPPDWVKNLVVGPAVSSPIFSNLNQRQPIIPLFDVNVSWKFGG